MNQQIDNNHKNEVTTGKDKRTGDNIIVYTDGASSGNPGPGGWGAVFRIENKVTEVGGSEEKTTNNRMEMKAAIESLKLINKDEQIDLFTDSQYLINGITKWIFGWQRNDWKTKNNDDVLNKDLWQELFDVVNNKKINWVGVSGHAGVPLNNRVDEIAVGFSKSVSGECSEPVLFSGTTDEYPFKVVEPTEEEINAPKTNSKKQKAYSYLSMINGDIQKHKTWDDCRARVSGVKGAKFRKSISEQDEMAIINEWK